MKTALITRECEFEKWGGDLNALYSIYEGLKEIGQDVIIGRTLQEVLHADFIFLPSTVFDLREDCRTVCERGKRFGIVGFHPDYDKYYNTCHGFVHFVGLCLADRGRAFFHIEQLVENPGILDVFSFSPPPTYRRSFPALEKAEVCIATSPTEAATMRRDALGCSAKVLWLETGIPDDCLVQKNNSFLEWTGLKEKDYVLQVGRIEPHKNQLGTVLAMRDLDIPLVLIATKSSHPFHGYQKMVFDAIRKWRRAPTLVISQTHASITEGSLRILQMPDGQKLPREMLLSAWKNAGAHLHPAFFELPGLVYLEAAKFGVPTVASEWTTVRDYFTDPITGKSTLDDRIVYAPPHHIQTLTELLLQQFGKKLDKTLDHPVFRRTKVDVATDLLAMLQSLGTS